MSEPGVLVSARLSALAAAQRAQGTRVGVGELLTAHRALASVDASSREDSRLALRAVLCSGRADLERFDRAFATVFGEARPSSEQPSLEELGTIERAVLPSSAIPGNARQPDAVAEETVAVPAAWSDVELLRHKDFAQYTEAEMVSARELIARLARRGPTRVSRRTRPVRRRSHAPDVRRVIASSLRTGGEPLRIRGERG